MIEMADLPELDDPIVIAAFEGWNDAGESASDMVDHLAELFGAEPVAAMDPEEYYDFQVNRPRTIIDDGERRIQWRTTRVLVATGTTVGRDLVLVQGVEPSFRWRRFTAELLEFCDAVGATTVVTIGALLADVPHSRPLPVTVTSDDETGREAYGLDSSHYEGSTGIIGVLGDAARSAGMQTVSTWVAVPHYAPHSPSPKATLALVCALEELFDAPIDHQELDEDARAWERGVDELAESDEDVAEYVGSLEEAQDTASLPEASGDAIAKEFERYLRRRGTGADS